jgi:TrpR-related protein YerC/YecD
MRKKDRRYSKDSTQIVEERSMDKHNTKADKAKKNLDTFFDAILSLKSRDECDTFFEDIFTAQELIDIPQRLEVALLLLENKTYQEVRDISGASNSTITRVNRCLKFGRGGYKQIEDRI